MAHGGNYAGSLSDLVNYAAFVQRRVSPGQPLPNLTYQRPPAPPVTQPPPRVEPSGSVTESSPDAPSPVPDPASFDQRPWYRSTLFLFLSFFLLPPVWAFLILTDRRQGCLLQLIAAGLFLFELSVCLLVVNSSALLDLIDRQIGTPAALLTAPPPAEEAPLERTASEPTAVIPESGADEACTIIWVEHRPDDLGRKNRAMVWEQIVKFQVEGSGMTHREFFDLVVEHNPDLVTDDYEFKRGKTYLLPECQ